MKYYRGKRKQGRVRKLEVGETSGKEKKGVRKRWEWDREERKERI